MSNGNFKYFIRNLTKLHRLSVNNAAGNEVWYSYTTALKIVGIIFLSVVVIFVATLIVADYTRILNDIPGYDGIRNREQMIENIIRVDSLERELSYMIAYTDNVAQIMEGHAPVIRSLKPQDEDNIATEKSLVPPSHADSILRLQMESGGRYGLNTATPSDAKERLKQMQLFAPVRGEVVRSFSSSDSFGTVVSVTDVQQIVAVKDGTVIVRVLEPEGYTIQVQHSGDLVSIYKGIGQAHKNVGDKVGAGEALGSTWSGDGSDTDAAGEVEVQLWYNGTAVDPEKYILFK